MVKRRRFTGEFKARVALEALRGERSIQDIAAKYGVHPNQVSTWKKQAIDGLGTVFSFNVWADWRPLGFVATFADKTFFDLLDYATVNLLIPLGGVLISVFVGWRMARSAVLDELGVVDGAGFKVWLFLLRVVAPLAILGVFISNLT